MFRKGIEISFLVSIILNYLFPKTMFADFFVLLCYSRSKLKPELTESGGLRIYVA